MAGDLIVDTITNSVNQFIDVKKYGSLIIIAVLVLIVIGVTYYKSEGFSSPDGVVSRRSQRQVRSDTEIDRTWNLAELEKSVALLNRKTGAQ